MNTLGRMDGGWVDGWSQFTGNTTTHLVFPVDRSDPLFLSLTTFEVPPPPPLPPDRWGIGKSSPWSLKLRVL